MQPDNERDLIRAWQSGSLPAAEAFVRQRQNEVRSVAYLLTLDRDQARGLAEAAFTRFFRAARNMDPDTDTRVEVLTRLGRSFLRKEFEAVPSLDSGFLAGPGPQKYGVENERGRTMAALGRFEERERVALILGEIGGFEPGQLNAVLEQDKSAMIAPIETVRQRFRHSLDIPQGQSIRPALLEAGFDGPREDLWPALQPDIAEIQRDEQRRGQLLTYGVAAGIVLVLLIAIVALFGNDIFNSDSDGTAASAGEDTQGQTLEGLESTPQPTSTPPPPTPTPFPLPEADLPGLLMVQESGGSVDQNVRLRLMQYDPERNQVHNTGDEELPLMVENLTGLFVTPDGEQLIMVQSQRDGEQLAQTAIAVDSTTVEQQWETHLGTIEIDRSVSFRGDPIAVSSDYMYFATVDPESSETTITPYDLSNGSPLEPVILDIAFDEGEVGQYDTVTLHVTADETRLLVFLHRVSTAADRSEQTRLVPLALPDLMQVESESRLFGDEEQALDPLGTTLAVDGNTLYRLDYGESGVAVEVDFFNLVEGNASTIAIPFESSGVPSPSRISTVMSHNGYHMYVIDTRSGDVAAINIVERRLERFFSIDPGSFESQFGTGEGQFVFSWANHLSMTGERLYVAAGVESQGPLFEAVEQSGIWVIDMHTWTIVDFWPTQGMVESIHDASDEDSVLVRSRQADSTANYYVEVGDLLRVGRIDGALVSEPVDNPSAREDANYWFTSVASLYRSMHGRSPGIDGVQPFDLATYSTLPRVEASGQTNNVSGVGTSFTVRIFDPVSGDLIAGQRDEVRFDPLSTISASLTLEDQPGQLVFLSQTEPGTYSGNVVLPADGSWAIDVSIIAPDGSTTVVPDAGRINVAPTLTGSDGKRYQFRLSYDPRFPIVDEPANFRIRLAEVESGATVSSDVDFDVEQYVLEGGTIDELPARISMSLGNPNTYFGTRSIVAGQVAHGVWEGTITFADPGIWTNAVRLQFGGLPLTEIYIRTIFVSDPPPESSVSEPEFWQGIAKT